MFTGGFLLWKIPSLSLVRAAKSSASPLPTFRKLGGKAVFPADGLEPLLEGRFFRRSLLAGGTGFLGGLVLVQFGLEGFGVALGGFQGSNGVFCRLELSLKLLHVAVVLALGDVSAAGEIRQIHGLGFLLKLFQGQGLATKNVCEIHTAPFRLLKGFDLYMRCARTAGAVRRLNLRARGNV